MSAWQDANLFGFALILFAGTLGFSLQRLRQPVARVALLTAVSIGCALAVAHGAYGIAYRAAMVTGVISVDGQAFDIHAHGWVLWDMLAIEPWFLIEGLLLGTTGYLAQDASDGRHLWLQAMVCGTLFAITTGAAGLKFA